MSLPHAHRSALVYALSGFGLSNTSLHIYERTGVVGTGNSARATAVNPGEELRLVKVGAVERALYAMPELYAHVLTLAYGAAGDLATRGGLDASLRWQAVAPLTEAAREAAQAWQAKQKRKGEATRTDPGPLVVRWLSTMTAAGAQLTDTDRERLALARSQASELLRAAESSFVSAYQPRA